MPRLSLRLAFRAICVIATLVAAFLMFLAWDRRPDLPSTSDSGAPGPIRVRRADRTAHAVSDRSWIDHVRPLLQDIARQLGDDGELLLEIGYDDPHQYNPTADYSFLERIDRFFVDAGLADRLITVCSSGVSPEAPVLTVVQREVPVAHRSVPIEVLSVCHNFLRACCRKSSDALDLCSEHVRDSSCQPLMAYVAFDGPVERSGYYVHEVRASGDAAWTAVVSLFSHYPDRNLELDPSDRRLQLDIRCVGDTYCVDSLPYRARTTLSTLADGVQFEIELCHVDGWGDWGSYSPWQVAVWADGQPVYRAAAEVVYQTDLADVTGDGVAELVLGMSVGGTFRGSGGLVVLQFADGRVIQRWPDGDPLGSRDAIGYGGELRDLTGDGIPEMVAEDLVLLHWGPMDELSHADQPFVPIIYQWSGDGYCYASPAFFEVYSDRVGCAEEAHRPAEGARRAGPADPVHNAYALLAGLVEIALCYRHLDSVAEGFHEIWNLVRGWNLEDAWRRDVEPLGQPPLKDLLGELQRAVTEAEYTRTVGSSRT